MTESGRIGVKAVSTVIAAVIVLTVFLALASAIYTGLLQLGNESSNLVKREAERAMESFFQIYWLNNTHVVLFNNHSSVPVTLLYWVSINPASGALHRNPA
jgi:FlaG/FlaF family flagellin (archaellin)